MATWGKVRGESTVPGRSVRREVRREAESPRVVPQALQAEIGRALQLVHGSTCVMTAAFEFKRGGMVVKRVMQCADEPPCVLVAVPKGQRLATLIRDSHGFALSIIEPSQRLILKKFGPEGEGDPFDMIETRPLPTGAPAIVRSLAAIDCEVMRHFDLEADYEVYVGQVIAAMVFAGGCAECDARNGSAMPGADAQIGAPHAQQAGAAGVVGVSRSASDPEAVKTPGRMAG